MRETKMTYKPIERSKSLTLIPEKLMFYRAMEDYFNKYIETKRNNPTVYLDENNNSSKDSAGYLSLKFECSPRGRYGVSGVGFRNLRTTLTLIN